MLWCQTHPSFNFYSVNYLLHANVFQWIVYLFNYYYYFFEIQVKESCYLVSQPDAERSKQLLDRRHRWDQEREEESLSRSESAHGKHLNYSASRNGRLNRVRLNRLLRATRKGRQYWRVGLRTLRGCQSFEKPLGRLCERKEGRRVKPWVRAAGALGYCHYEKQQLEGQGKL